MRYLNEAEARADYQADLAKRPTYHDGTPRKTWEQLSEPVRATWRRKDHDRPGR